MKKETVTIEVYEPGDIIEIVRFKKVHHKTGFDTAKRFLVIQTRALKNGAYSYKVITDEGKAAILTAQENDIGEFKHVDTVDISMLFKKEKN